MIKLAMWQIVPSHWFVSGYYQAGLVFDNACGRLMQSQLPKCTGIPQVGWGTLPWFQGLRRNYGTPIGVPSTFELDTAATIVQYKTTADDVDFVSRCSGTTTAQTWIASRLCSPCWRGLPHGASSSETMRARKKIFSSVGLNRCVHR